jgi:hypothetical protein
MCIGTRLAYAGLHFSECAEGAIKNPRNSRCQIFRMHGYASFEAIEGSTAANLEKRWVVYLSSLLQPGRAQCFR